MSKYKAFSGPYFPVFGLNTGKNGPENTPYLDTFHAVGHCSSRCSHIGPVHHGSDIWFPYTPLLPISAGFWLLGTCLKVIYALALILLILFDTNCL